MTDCYIKGLGDCASQSVGVKAIRLYSFDFSGTTIVTRFSILTDFSEAAITADISETISCSAISKSFLLDCTSEPTDLMGFLSASSFSFYSNRNDFDFSLFIYIYSLCVFFPRLKVISSGNSRGDVIGG